MTNEFKRTPTHGENDVDLRVATEPRRVTDAVLSQIIATKDGEIAALTAEVTHLAEKLAERDVVAASSTDWRVYHSALSECAELLPNMKDGDPLTETPKFLAEELAAPSVDRTGVLKSARSLVAAFNDPACSVASLQNYVSDLSDAMAPQPVDAAQAVPGVRQLTAQLHDGQTWTVAEQRAFAQVLAAFPNESSQGIISLGDAWKHGQAYAESAFAGQAAQRETPEDDRRDAAAYRALNTPEIADFVKGVESEAMHQRDRWGAEHDAGKAPEDWFWLLGYLGGKALHAAKTGNNGKALHHTISSAAALLNWHAAILGAYTGMRPGITQPTDTTKGA